MPLQASAAELPVFLLSVVQYDRDHVHLVGTFGEHLPVPFTVEGGMFLLTDLLRHPLRDPP